MVEKKKSGPKKPEKKSAEWTEREQSKADPAYLVLLGNIECLNLNIIPDAAKMTFTQPSPTDNQRIFKDKMWIKKNKQAFEDAMRPLNQLSTILTQAREHATQTNSNEFHCNPLDEAKVEKLTQQSITAIEKLPLKEVRMREEGLQEEPLKPSEVEAVLGMIEDSLRWFQEECTNKGAVKGG